MIDIAELEKRINENLDLRARFIAEPAKVLEDEGIMISPQMAASLIRLIKSQVDDEAGVPGSLQSPRAGGRPPRPFGLP